MKWGKEIQQNKFPLWDSGQETKAETPKDTHLYHHF